MSLVFFSPVFQGLQWTEFQGLQWTESGKVQRLVYFLSLRGDSYHNLWLALWRKSEVSRNLDSTVASPERVPQLT